MFESTIISGQIYLGKQGEHCARRLSFNDVRIWSEIFGEGVCELIHQRNGDEAPYPIAMEIDNGVPYWCVSSADTAIAGEGKCEIRYIVNGTVVKSNIYNTFVQESLGEGTAEPPEPQNTWVDVVVQAGAEAKQSAMSADVAKSASEEYAEQSKSYSEDAENHSQNAQKSADNAHKSAEDAQRERELSSTFATESKNHADFASKKAEEIKVYADDVSANAQIIEAKAQQVSEDASVVKNAITGMNTTFANALRGNVSGVDAVRLDGVSPVEHKFEINTTEVLSYGKNLFNFVKTTENNYVLPQYPIGITLTISMKRTSSSGTVQFQKSTDGVSYTRIDYLGTSSRTVAITFTVEEGCSYRVAINNQALPVVESIQVELGSNETVHEEYKEPVDGAVLVCPTTTLIAKNTGETIEVTYNKDINYVVAELTAAIVSLGGKI